MERTLKRQFLDIVGELYQVDVEWTDYAQIQDRSMSNFGSKKGSGCFRFNRKTGNVICEDEVTAGIIEQLIEENNKQDVFKVILD